MIELHLPLLLFPHALHSSHSHSPFVLQQLSNVESPSAPIKLKSPGKESETNKAQIKIHWLYPSALLYNANSANSYQTIRF